VNPWIAVLLGIVQGATEFLPISSTAHLTLSGKVFGLIDPARPEAWTAFIAVMQLGTLAAVVLYFWRDVAAMTVALVRDLRAHGPQIGRYGPESRLALAIILGTVPVVVIGFAFRHVIEGTLTKSTAVMASSLIGLALLLWLAERVSRHVRAIPQLTWVDSLVIGTAQALALIPGSSRSGTTLTAGLFLGLRRDDAARFSFLLSIPAVFASGLFEMMRINPSVFDLGVGNLIVATAVSGVSGYAAIAWLLRYLRTHSTMIFVWYRLALGTLLFVLLSRGLIDR
jgi:undecaprenyl-diphosphatase